MFVLGYVLSVLTKRSVMKIRDLKEDYPLVYERALACQEAEYKDVGDYTDIQCAFMWDDTEEGWPFWSYVNNEVFDKAKKLCPHLFEPKGPISEIKAGRMAIKKDDAEITRECLDYCFPDDGSSDAAKSREIELFVYFSQNTAFRSHWTRRNETDLPVIKASELWGLIPDDKVTSGVGTGPEPSTSYVMRPPENETEIRDIALKYATSIGERCGYTASESYIDLAREIEGYINNG